MKECTVCFHHCKLEEGKRGLCGGRRCVGGEILPENYGKITSIALDPIEKKPLYHFFPGSRILSVGSYGCNLRCPFCQNYEIARPDVVPEIRNAVRELTPEELLKTAFHYKKEGNIGIAFTYNEPLVGYEFVRDTARLFRENGMKTVLVTNGTAGEAILETLLPCIDAMNVDLKSWSPSFYRDFIKGDIEMTKSFIRRSAGNAHVEVTTLIVPGKNDSEKEMEELAGWLSELEKEKDCVIPLHITRFFPRFQYDGVLPTDKETLFRLVEVARRHLPYVYAGNV